MVHNPVEELRIDLLGEIRAYTTIETEVGTTKKHLTCIWFDKHENSTDMLKEGSRLHIALTEDDTVINLTQVLLNSLLDSDHFKAYEVQDKK
jgi:chitinase